MSLSPRTFSNLQTLTDTSDAMNAPLVVVPWSQFGARRLYVDTADGQHVGWVDLKTGHRSLVMPELAPAFEAAVSEADDAPTESADARMPRRALEQAIESALIAGYAALQADEEPALMRHAYRGKQAYSSWDVGACGKRLAAEDLDRPLGLDPHWAYLNPIPAEDHHAEVAHLFA